MSAGFDAARGEVVITIDADLQNDPNDIPKLLELWEQGYDIVSGWRKDRKEKFLTRRLPSMTANKLISVTTGVQLHDYGCTLKAYDRAVAKVVELYGELHRFVPAVASSMGVRVAEVPVNDRARKFGSSKYGIGRTFRVVIDLTTVLFLLKYARRPMHIFGTLGFFFAFLGTIVGLYLTYERLVLDMGLSERPLLLLAILLVILGVQMISIGLVAEIVMRTYYNPQGQPAYSIRYQLDAARPRSQTDDEQDEQIVMTASHR
jgi:glycosyltransferase involved in cell wall biosynthesis